METRPSPNILTSKMAGPIDIISCLVCGIFHLNSNSNFFHPALLTVDSLFVGWFRLFSSKVPKISDESQVTWMVLTSAHRLMYAWSCSLCDGYLQELFSLL